MSKGSSSLSFKYNESGIRTSKTVGSTTTEYFLDGSNIIAQKTGSTILWFYYDGNGKLTAMQNGNSGKYYYYAYNNQGDIVALIDGSTFAYAVEYTYDSWGKLISVTGDTTIGNLNPFRYRGYYYDTETGLYYLQSRYYNPEIWRFLNADGIIGANSNFASLYNLFTYCSNNPINLYDPFGLCDLKGTGKQGPCLYPPNDPRSCNYRKQNTVIGGNKNTSKSLDIKGPKNSKKTLYDENGNLYQERWYDENGNAIRDRDYTDHGNPNKHPEVPHDHQWDHSGSKPDRGDWLPPDYNNYNFQNEAANGIIVVVVTVIGIIIFALTGVPVA